jgi:hypothetical protein
MLPNLQNRIVNTTRHWGQKEGKMRTLQVENKMFYPFRTAAPQLSRKSLSLNNLSSIPNWSHSDNLRQTLVNHFMVKTYDRRKTEIRLIDPVTFQSKIGNRKLKIGFSPPVTFYPLLSLSCWLIPTCQVDYASDQRPATSDPIIP